MEEEKVISYYEHEHEMARMERMVVRLVKVVIFCIIAICVICVANLYFWNQYEYVGEESTSFSYNQDGLGVNIIGTHNEVDNGSKADDNKDEEASPKEEEREE